MERFYLERPSIKRKEEIIEYINEFVKYNSNINGTGSWDKILAGYTFEQALERCFNIENEEYAKNIGRCPGKTFLLIRENDNKIVGSINVRWNLNEAMLQFGGHIGYGIRPTERRKGYNKINLYLGLIEAQKLGLDKDDQIIGYKYVHLGKMMDNIKKGIDPKEAIEKASGTYGRFDEAVKKIDPREE